VVMDTAVKDVERNLCASLHLVAQPPHEPLHEMYVSVTDGIPFEETVVEIISEVKMRDILHQEDDRVQMTVCCSIHDRCGFLAILGIRVHP
jgi:hypothetical protein